ncbi:MAG: thioredoxin [Candidatus Bathyarchaeales archaeon]
MCGERERLISEEDEELMRIREKKLKEFMRLKEKNRKMSTKPVQLTDSNFNEIVNKHSLALIDCWASWCAPCVVIAPIIEELAKGYAGKILVGKLNVDENPRTAERFQIFGIPTLLIMKNGKEVDRIVGLVPKNHIEARLKKYME